MEFIIEVSTGKKHFLADFTVKNKLEYAERLIESGAFVGEDGMVSVSTEDGIKILETEKALLIKEREELETEKALLIKEREELEKEKSVNKNESKDSILEKGKPTLEGKTIETKSNNQTK